MAVEPQFQHYVVVQLPKGQSSATQTRHPVDPSWTFGELVEKLVNGFIHSGDQYSNHYVLQCEGQEMNKDTALGDQFDVDMLNDIELQLMHRSELNSTARKYSMSLTTSAGLKGGVDMVAKHLKTVPIFGQCSAKERKQIACLAKHGQWMPGDRIFRQGDENDAFFIITEGVVSLCIKEEIGEVNVGTLQTGDYFGHEPGAREYTAICSKPTSTLSLTKGDYQDLLNLKIIKNNIGRRRFVVHAEKTELLRRPRAHSPRASNSRKKTEDVIRFLKEAVISNPLFVRLDEQQIHEICRHFFRLDIGNGLELVSQGDIHDYFFVIFHGEIELSFVDQVGDEIIVEMKERGGSFGALSLIYNAKSEYTYRAKGDGQIYGLDRHQFKHIVMKTSEAKLQDYMLALLNVKVFDSLLDFERKHLAQSCDEVYFDSGDTVIVEGTENDVMYIIRSGCASISVPEDEEFREVDRLGPGDIFGMESLFTGQKAKANIQAVGGPMNCLTIDKFCFETILGPLEDILARHVQKIEENFAKIASPELREYICEADIQRSKVLGKGAFGKVFLVKHHIRNEYMALKALSKGHICLNDNGPMYLFQEKNVMLMLNSPFLVRLFGTYQDEEYCYLVLELALGGELYGLLTDYDQFDEEWTRFYTGCCVLGLEHMHNKGIIFRDLKPENILLDVRGYAKITDFGFGKVIGHNQNTFTMCGTPDYIAPELIRGAGYSFGADWWTLGILIFEMLTGYPPFHESGQPALMYQRIMKGEPHYPTSLSKQSKQIIKDFLKKIPVQRLGVVRGGSARIKDHEFFTHGEFDWSSLRAQTMEPPYTPEVENEEDMREYITSDSESDSGFESYEGDEETFHNF